MDILTEERMLTSFFSHSNTGVNRNARLLREMPMLVGWRDLARDTLTDKLSFLADVVIDEVLANDLKITENELRVGLVGEFLKALYYRLPPDVNRHELILRVRDKLMSAYHLQPKCNGKDVL